MRVLVTGSRDWTDRKLIYREIGRYIAETCPLDLDYTGTPIDYNTTDVTLIHGDCPTGADLIAYDWAINNWVKVERYPANWAKYGKRAGYVRNLAMVESGADVCLAFVKDNSKGATMTIKLATKAGIPVRRFND